MISYAINLLNKLLRSLLRFSVFFNRKSVQMGSKMDEKSESFPPSSDDVLPSITRSSEPSFPSVSVDVLPSIARSSLPSDVPMSPTMIENISSMNDLLIGKIEGLLKNTASPTLPRRGSSEFNQKRGLPKRVPSLSKMISQYVADMGGDNPIFSVLVANNGLAAVKFMRSTRSWATQSIGNPRAISLVAMATPDDMRINAEHLQLADQFVEVPGGSNNNNYANVRLIVQIAERTGVDAVWPGWGHASENPDLPATLAEKGIRFLGPPSAAMAALGDKIGSTILAQAAGVPTLPWSGTGVSVSYADCPDGTIPPEIYNKACIFSMDEALAACNNIGYPVMLKASWGGGGKGIRKVYTDEDVQAVFRQIQGEVPGSPIFAMKLAPKSRHLEVQLMADMYGNVVSLYSRDCSIQRRHQKIVEEGPVTAAPAHILLDMERCARALARSVGYVGAATVEYLYCIEEEQYYFLELNPRLQVEHPVTEGITGVNIPSVQLKIAMGIPLWRMPTIRSLYNKDPNGTDSFDMENTPQKAPEGHVVAVRITSEDANDGFKPTCGRIDELHFRPTPEVWAYFSVKSGGGIHEYADSQFGHLFAKAATRDAAIRSMIVALQDVVLRGEIRTIVDYVTNMLQDPSYLRNDFHTGWLDLRIADRVKAQPPPWHLSVIAGAVVRAMDCVSSQSANYLGYLAKGQLPPANISLTYFTEEMVIDGFKYYVKVARRTPDMYRVELNGSSVDVATRKMVDGGFLMQVDGESHVVHSEEEALGSRLIINNLTTLLAKEVDPSRLISVSPGKLVRFLVDSGTHVKQGAPYAEIEVMKMMMPLVAPAAGVITFVVPEGTMLQAGDLIARLDLDDPKSVLAAEVFPGVFPELGPPVVEGDRADQHFTAAFEAAKMAMAGYVQPLDSVIDSLARALDDPTLALLQWNEQLSVVNARLPAPLLATLTEITRNHEAEIQMQDVHRLGPAGMEFPGMQLMRVMEAAVQMSEPNEQASLLNLLQNLLAIASAHSASREEYAQAYIKQLLTSFLDVEEAFVGSGKDMTDQETVDALRKVHANNLQAVLDMVVAHQALNERMDMVKRLLARFVLPAPQPYRDILRRLAALNKKATAELALKAKHLLEHSLLGDLRSAVARALSGLEMFSDSTELTRGDMSASGAGDANTSGITRKTLLEGLFSGLSFNPSLDRSSLSSNSTEAKMEMLVHVPAAVEEALASILVDIQDITLLSRALPTYIRRVYYPYLVKDPYIVYEKGVMAAVWIYTGPRFADSPVSRTRLGTMMVIRSVEEVSTGLSVVRQICNQLGRLSHYGVVLHVAVAGDDSFESSSDSSRQSRSPYGNCDEDEMVTAGEFAFCKQKIVESEFRETSVLRSLAVSLNNAVSELKELNITGIAVVSKGTGTVPVRTGYVVDKMSGKFVEQQFLRQLEFPTMSLLEVEKLSLPVDYAPSRNHQWHLYTSLESKDFRGPGLKRTYLRGVVRQLGQPALLAASYIGNASAVASAAIAELEDPLLGCLEELSRFHTVAKGDEAGGAPDWVHIYHSVLPPLPLSVGVNEVRVAASFKAAAAALVGKHISALRKAAVAAWEVRLRGPPGEAPWRICVLLPTGHESGDKHVEVYREVLSPSSDPPSLIYQAMHSDAMPPLAGTSGTMTATMAGKPILKPYELLEPLQRKRLAARKHGVTYCYDFPTLFEDAVREIWAARALSGEPCSIPPANRLVEAEELILTAGHGGSLKRTVRPIGTNDVGMIAWVMTMCTPECPQGRQIVAVANDITFQSGAFAPGEHAVFLAAAEYALEQRLPLVYLAANSGARVGLATEVRDALRVELVDPSNPSKGFKYLYLTDADYQRLTKRGTVTNIVKATQLETPNGLHWVITDVIGSEDGIGVECLSGSGAIASVYCRAFREGYTVTLVSGRTVGIGAYLARLGRRVVQRVDQPVILTGYAALNKLLGRQVYTSQMQLGGPRVMGANGVSHHIVQDDIDGIKTILNLLSYVPQELNSPAPVLPSSDPVDRLVTYNVGPSEKLDPRAAIAGRPDPLTIVPNNRSSGSLISTAGNSNFLKSNNWQSGLFDRGSWMESQAGWARTVVVGRARLGGLPVGVIAVETQTVKREVPADPGMPETAEQSILQAGQVWYPDSAAKTAAAIEEFQLEGLPLFILANWRGFSGGQRDLFDGVLQAGSTIVEALRAYSHPVFVYIPCTGELRGGAWAVVDTQINSWQIEMYADPGARGGVLEPEGVVQIKFRTPDILKLLHRTDPMINTLKANAASLNPAELTAAIRNREEALLPIYRQVATTFADMHDTPVRMLAKGTLRAIVPWSNARMFFATRLRRRLAQETLVRHVNNTDASLARRVILEMLRSWHTNFTSQGSSWQMANRVLAAQGALSQSIDSWNSNMLCSLTPQASMGAAQAMLLPTLEEWEQLMEEDKAFLEWAESTTGRAHIAVELRALRSRAAATIVSGVLSTSDGRDGLMHALEEAMRRDNLLTVQIKMMMANLNK